MAGVASGRSRNLRPYNGVSSGQEGESSAEWQTSGQLENGTPSTSPSFWNTDDDDEDCGLSPSQLYGTYNWTIDKFSQINKRELRSDAFEVGGYKWYILIYPQGCDVCNHLSLFLCVDNHDKLLPGWSHFAQFTIAVVNSDAKKSKYSDTLHRFWKKEHDWGWKKFMELTKVLDGFVEDDKLTIKAQVQVIREKVDRPFRCLEWNYRRELVRVYLTNVEQIFRRFVEEKRSTFWKLIEDKARWASFCSFWLGIDQKSKCIMIKERTDSILRVVVKQFFIEKEVTSTLVMDSLHSGLKALERQIKNKKSWRNLLGSEELPIPVVHIDQDMFILVDDVLLLLERVALEPLPPRDEKGPQNRMKDGSSGDDCSNESHERDLIRLTVLARRTIEIFVLDHIFSCKIEVAYQEAIALKRQEELIREEEVWLETEQKSKRGAAEKDKKSKKKQGKQKRNNRKGKDKGRDDNTIANALDNLQLDVLDESKAYMAEETKPELVRPEIYEDVSDVSDTVDHVTELLHPDAEERESSTLSPVQNGESNGSCTVVDDSSSTCSTDSVTPVVMNGFIKANNPLPHQENHRSPSRENKQRDRASSDMSGWVNEVSIRSSDVRKNVGSQNDSGSRKAESEPKAATESLQNKLKKVDPQVVKGPLVSHLTEPIVKDQIKTTVSPSSSIGSTKHTPSPIQPKLEPNIPAKISTKHTPSPIQPKLEPNIPAKISIKRPLSDNPQLAPSVTKSADMAPHKSTSPPKPTEKQEIPSIMSRPSSAPIVPGPRPTTPVVSIVQSQPLLSRSVSAVGPLGLDTTSSPHHHQSYRNAMMGTNIVTPPTSTSSGYTTQPMYFNPTQANSIYQPMFRTVDPPFVQNDVPAPDIFNQVRIASRNSQLGDEFPHLDIINDLLDDEYGTSTSFRSFDGGSQHLHRQFSYPGDIGIMTSEMLVGPSSNSSRFQRTHSYHENGFQPNYSSFGDPFEPTRDFFPQPSIRPFPNQWQVAGSDWSRTSDGGGYGYHIPDYSNLAGNSNGYSLYRPSNG